MTDWSREFECLSKKDWSTNCKKQSPILTTICKLMTTRVSWSETKKRRENYARNALSPIKPRSLSRMWRGPPKEEKSRNLPRKRKFPRRPSARYVGSAWRASRPSADTPRKPTRTRAVSSVSACKSGRFAPWIEGCCRLRRTFSTLYTQAETSIWTGTKSRTTSRKSGKLWRTIRMSRLKLPKMRSIRNAD